MNKFLMFFVCMILYIKYVDLQESKYEWFLDYGLGSWFVAFKACRNKGGHLAVIKSEAEFIEIKELFWSKMWNNKAYIGVHKLFQNDKVDIFGNQLEWIHNILFNHKYGCISNDELYGENTNEYNIIYNYICEFPDESTPELETTESYYLINRNKVTWPEARSYCRNRGGHLIIINNEEELNYVTEIIKNENILLFWAGYHNMFHNDEIILENGDFPQSQYLKWIIPCETQQKYGALNYTGETILEDPEEKHAFVCEIKYKYARKYNNYGRNYQLV